MTGVWSFDAGGDVLRSLPSLTLYVLSSIVTVVVSGFEGSYSLLGSSGRENCPVL